MVVKIVIATHKKYKMPVDKCYIPLQVGASNHKDLGYQKDNEGNNISKKNSEYKGLVHYRRYFVGSKRSDTFESILTNNEFEKILKKYDLIIPKKRHYYIETLRSHYKHTHYESQLIETRKVINDLFPHYIPTFDKVNNRTWGYMFNMMVMRDDLFDNYCMWLFSILFELEDRVEKGMVDHSQNLSAFQARFYGRISEILFNVWLQYQLDEGVINLSMIKEERVAYLGKVDWKRKVYSFILAKFFNKRYSRSF